MRKLVTLREVSAIEPIPGADAIEKLVVDGWEVVAKKGEFQPGNPCVYFEIDSFLPVNDSRFHFLAKGGVKKDPSGRERIRLKSIKLRKQLSQGLALPLHMFPELNNMATLVEDNDFSELLDVTKYERPEPKAGNASGNFPQWIPKTDEERVQNLYGKWSRTKQSVGYWPTMKLDGSSITMIYVPWGMDTEFYETWEDGELPNALNDENGQFQICSRNMKLKYDEDSHFWKGFLKSGIRDFMKTVSRLYLDAGPIVFQGEIMGPGIQGNREKFTDYRVYLFNMYNVLNGGYELWSEFYEMYETYGINLDVNMVPYISQVPIKVFSLPLNRIMELTEGPSINNPIREGIVWKGEDGSSFKSISNEYLLKSET